MKLLLDHVSKKYGNKYALKDLNIEFSDGVYEQMVLEKRL